MTDDASGLASSTPTTTGLPVAVPPAPAPVREPWLTPARLVSLVAVLVATYAALAVVRALRNILVMLLLALFISFAMEPAVQHLARRGWKRGAATGAVFLAVGILSVGFVAAMAPLVIDQVQGLVDTIRRAVSGPPGTVTELPFGLRLPASPELSRQLSRFQRELEEGLRGLALGAASNVVTIGATALGVIFQLLTVALVTFYLVADGPRFRRVLARPLPPERQREMLAIWELAVAKTGGYIYSRVLLAAVSAAAHLLLFFALVIPYPVPLALWVGITSAFVPVVGTYIGGLLVLLVTLLNDPWDAVWVALFAVMYQQIENYLLAPRIQARTMDVHPAVAFVSVLIGGSLLGAAGALLALPATAILQALLSTYVRRHQLIAELGDIPLGAGDPDIPNSRTTRKVPA